MKKQEERGNKFSENIVLSVEQMRKSDAYTIENFVSGRELMQRAARGVFDAVSWDGKRIAIVCGGGNNGGDGYALSGILADSGYFPTVFMLSDKFTSDGKFYYDKANEKGVEFIIVDENISLDGFDIVVDCIFGTGFKDVPKGLYADVIEKINSSKAFVLSVDINSGMNGDTGEGEIVVKSDLTVSIGFFKTCMFSEGAKGRIGKLVNVDIGIVPLLD